MKPASRHYLTVFRNTRRLYATQVAGKRAEGKTSVAAQDVKVSKLPNGVPIASLENYSPVSRVAVIFNAGPRYEPIDKLGLTHCLRMASNLRSQKSTAFGIARNLQQLGATFTCTTTKEHMIYSMECLRQDIELCTELLSQVALTPSFKQWELEDVERALLVDVNKMNLPPHARVMELIHKAAFRDTLGRSLVMTQDRIGSFTPEALEEFTSTHYVSGNMAVAAVGMDHDTLTELVNKMPVRDGQKPAVMQKAKFYGGGEERLEAKSSLVHAAIATEGVKMTSKDLLSVGLISKVLACQAGLEYSSTKSATKLHKAAAGAVPDENFALSSIVSAYSDSGLFGVQTVTTPQNVGKVLKSVIAMMRQLNKAGITDAELKQAKEQLKLSLLLESDGSDSLLENMALDLLVSGDVHLPAETLKHVDAVTLDTVNKVCKKIMSGRPSMAAVGNMVQTPYLSEILL